MSSHDFVDHLEKWQARSHPELADRKPEDLFEASFVEQYHKLHKRLWWRIIRVHETIRTLEELRHFPFDYLYAPNDMEFWHLVVTNFIDMACLLLHGLVTDRGRDVHSIQSFRDSIMKGPWLDPQKCNLFQQTLKERKFDTEVREIAERVGRIRDHRIAHALEKSDGAMKEEFARIRLDELRRLFDATHSIFGALSFGGSYVTLAGDLMPRTVKGKPTPSCLGELLTLILRDSHFVNRPKLRAQWWADERHHIDPEQLRTMNECRNRLGLPEA
jgi:hypothetical protein